MAKRKQLRGRKRRNRPAPVIDPNAAGIHVGATEVYVAVPTDRDSEPVRTFDTFTRDFHNSTASSAWISPRSPGSGSTRPIPSSPNAAAISQPFPPRAALPVGSGSVPTIESPAARCSQPEPERSTMRPPPRSAWPPRAYTVANRASVTPTGVCATGSGPQRPSQPPLTSSPASSITSFPPSNPTTTPS